MKTWIKLYTEIVDDPKIGRLSLADHGLWLLLMALAGKIDHRDQNGNATGQLDTLDNIAWHLRHSADEIAPGIERLTGAGMLHVTDGIITVTHFAERQERPSETPTAVSQRVKRHRAKTRQDKTQTETQRNGAVTAHNDDETPLESESDSDTESDSDPEQTTTDTDHAPTHRSLEDRRSAVADAGAPSQSTHRAVGKSAPESVSSVQSVSKSVCATDADSLRSAGVTEPALSRIVDRKLSAALIEQWVNYANRQPKLKNKAGFLVAMLTMPDVKPPPESDVGEVPAQSGGPPKSKTWFTDEEYERFFLHPTAETPRS